MALVVCELCKKAFINGPHFEKACPACRDTLRDVGSVVRNFLRDNERELFTVYDINRILGVDMKVLDALVATGMVESNTQGYMKPYERDKKLGAMDPALAREVLRGGKSSMHQYDKKKEPKSAK
ncbi:hypothetical protein AGMMS49957_09690 [Synergistales bacterium]|nr:hypothetical protein AGMMS49957_09690 [Synergistales bacterium]